MAHPEENSTSPLRKTWRSWLFAAGLTSLLAPAVVVLALRLAGGLLLELGPGDAPYVQGTLSPWRLNADGTTWREADLRARLHLPITVRGPGRVVLALAQPGPTPIVLRVLFDDGTAREVTLEPSKELLPVALEIPDTRTRANLRLRAEGGRFRIAEARWDGGSPLPQASLIRNFLLLTLATLGALALAGLSPAAALAGTGILALVLTFVGRVSPFAFVDWIGVGAAVSIVGLAVVAVARWVSPQSTGALRVVLYFAVLSRAAMLFHPSFYFTDLPIHETLLELVYHRGLVDFWRNLPQYQVRYNLGVGALGDAYQAYPYSALFYFFAHLGNRAFHAPEFWLKTTFPVASVLPILPLGFLARTLSGLRHSDVLAAAVFLAAPAYFLALFVLELSSLNGHFFDLLVLAFLAWARFSLETPRRLFALTGLVFLSLAAYTSGFINVGLYFASVLVLAMPTKAMDVGGMLRFAIAGLAGAFLALASYHPTTVGNVLQSVLPQGVEVASQTTAAGGSADFLGRLSRFLGAPLLLVGGAGAIFFILRERASAALRLLVLAWGLSGLVAFALRYFFRDLLQYQKEMYWIAALLSVGAGVLLARLARIPRYGRLSVALLLGALAAAGIARFVENVPLYFDRYRFL